MSAPIRLTVQVRYFDVAALLLRAPPVGTMSRRRKHVRNQLDEACPELNEGDAVCRVVEIRGGNQIEVRGRGRVYVCPRATWGQGMEIKTPPPPPPPPPLLALSSLSFTRLLPPPSTNALTHCLLTHTRTRTLHDIHQVEKPDTLQTLIRIPSKFSKILWAGNPATNRLNRLFFPLFLEAMYME